MSQNVKKWGTTASSRVEETRRIHKVVFYGFLLNLTLAVMKGFLAFFSGSLALFASAIDSGADAVASLVIYAGVRLSTRKTRSFPLGLHKLENVASVVIAFFIFIAGYEIIQKVLSPATRPLSISFSYILLFIAGTAATFIFGQYALSIGRKTGSPTLIADGRQRQVDVLASIVVLISIALSYFNLHLDIFGITVDQLGAALILIFIVRSGWELLADGMRVLLDASIDFSTLDQIREIIRSEPTVNEIKFLSGRNSGRFRFIQTDISLKTEDLHRAHQISKDLESKIRDQVPHVEKVLIHYEPDVRSHEHIGVPLDDATGRISSHFGEAPYFGIVRICRKNKEVENQRVVENPYCSVETAKGIRVAEWMVQQGIEHIGIKEDVSRKGPAYVLSNAGVKIHIISADQLNSAIREIITEGL